MAESGYAHREAATKYALKESRSKRDIGEIPEVKRPELREEATESLTAFCRGCQPGIFTRKFAPIHDEVISRLEISINTGGLYAYAMPRATGKTSLAEAACIWAIVTGKRLYVVLISATERHGTQSLENIKKELGTNELILDCWPEVVFPVHCLEGIAHRAAGQLYEGSSTHIVWRGEQLVLPSIPGSLASSSVIEVRGLTGAIRGMKANLPGGRGSIRPELVVLDDPQTDESAKSPSQCRDRERTIKGTVLGLAGHEQQIAAVMPCTVIHKGDLADSFLDSEKHPEWHGVKTRLLVSMPTNMKLWDQYHDFKRLGDDRAKEFYILNREEMDEGAEPIWPECFNKHQLSAVQYAMDLKSLVGEVAFWAEYQNEPLDDVSDGEMADVDDIIQKVTKYKRHQMPLGCQHITMGIDVHKNALFYTVCGWDERFNGYVIDYGTWPETKRKFFTLRDIRKTLLMMYPGRGEDGAIYAGLKDLTEKMLSRSFGAVGEMSLGGTLIERCIIDANWKTSVVKTFCRESKTSATVLISGHGRYIGAGRKQLNDYRKAAGDRMGQDWRIPAQLSREGVRHVIYDTNFWKTFVNNALITPPGERGCLQLFDSAYHKLFAEHLTSEFFVQVSGRGRTVNEWTLHTGRDNHWFDCIVACAMAACMQGCKLIDSPLERPRRKMRIRYLDG